jgi:cobalamin biosynthesis protein CobT
MIPAKLRYEVKRLFENTATESFERNLKSGRLNVRALTRHSISPNLFQRRYEEEGIDSAVVILLDVSGSMYDGIRGKAGQPRTTRMASAAPTCAALLETLSAAQVATALVTFDDYTSVLKPWNMNARKAITLLESIDGMGGSDDATALMHVHNMLYRRPEQRRLCFVLTDGQGDIRQAKAQVIVRVDRMSTGNFGASSRLVMVFGRPELIGGRVTGCTTQSRARKSSCFCLVEISVSNMLTC